MRHYFDHAATTQMRPSAIAMWDQYARQLGNPSAIHGAGRQARKVVEDSRETMAEALQINP
ncbi:MAG: aminotransferase class V-fold PLP-dependent enzyme, partial [Propionibacteriaceae bacterium]|nr:aminotransferase class V-fold PLP-dependent enzyme [Propionibacteriaceae bacterium]